MHADVNITSFERLNATVGIYSDVNTFSFDLICFSERLI